MAWNALLLGMIGVYATYKTGSYTVQFKSLKYLGYSIGALFFTLIYLSSFLEAVLNAFNMTIYAGQLSEWFEIIAVSFILSGLALLIRESKPVFAQFPLIYTAVPLLVVVSYWLVKDTLAIKEWLMSIYQGGALLVAILMYGVHSYRIPQFIYTFAASLFFLITFVVYWFVPGVQGSYPWIWQLLLGISVLMVVYGLEHSINTLEKQQANRMEKTVSQ
ncbi:MAG: hypothetical protein R3224_10020 [Balneolaceae bacterium]|nr:hypothetical protein [Balneolaceae bacterium]